MSGRQPDDSAGWPDKRRPEEISPTPPVTPSPPLPFTPSPLHPLIDTLLALALLLGFLALYTGTAAPSVLSGDSAEFQFAAPLLGVPHPTTYPLYVLLGKLSTLVLPFGDLARRVTLVSAGCAALAVALFFFLARRLGSASPAAALAALALGFAPGLWNAATLAEVYALLMALLMALGYLIATTDHRPTTNDGGQGDKETRRGGDKETSSSPAHPLTPSPLHPLSPSLSSWRLRGAVFVAGLGFTHHGLFLLVGLPPLLGYVVWLALHRIRGDKRRPLAGAAAARDTFRQLAVLALCFAAGMAPWLYPLVQYARYGPFDGDNYGLPRHYFWGAPMSWGATIDLLTGGTLRREIFHAPSLESSLAVLRMAGGRLLFEFGPLGALLGLLGCGLMARRTPVAWLAAAWVVLATLAYLLLLGPAVEDGPVFTLPMLLPWALWIGVGVNTISDGNAMTPRPRWRAGGRWALVVVAALALATLAWGYTRVSYSNKRHLWLFRSFGEATLDRLPPGAVVITHWEQGMTLQYLVLAERRRPDVWVDVVEPGDDPWDRRTRQRYAGRPIFFVGAPSDVAGLPVELVREDEYADLFRWRGK